MKDMTNDEFKNLFNADEIAELEAAEETVTAEVPVPVDAAPANKANDGLRYSHDAVAEGSEDCISWYQLVVDGKTVLWVAINNDRPVLVNHPLGKMPKGATFHNIMVLNADKTKCVVTKGLAARYEHKDGTGTHIDSHTVRSYVRLRVMRYVAAFYGI